MVFNLISLLAWSFLAFLVFTDSSKKIEIRMLKIILPTKALLAFIETLVLYEAHASRPHLLRLSDKLEVLALGTTIIVIIIFGVIVTHKDQEKETPPQSESD